jgi:uncharacterized membrane protein YhaH (DUF805 family)
MQQLNPYEAPKASLYVAEEKSAKGLRQLLFSFEGRISRAPFIAVQIGLMVYVIAVVAIDQALNEERHDFVTTLLIVPTLWPSLTSHAKRWHDKDHSGWWILINAIPIAGPLWAFVANWFLRGTEGPNRFGQDPLE